jgi:hypothetical protein
MTTTSLSSKLLAVYPLRTDLTHSSLFRLVSQVMPLNVKSRKRKASSAPSTPAKKVRIGSTISIPDPPAASPSGRPKRASVGEPTYNFKRNQSADKNPSPVSVDSDGRKTRGRPPKPSGHRKPARPAEEHKAVTPKKRGRPRKSAACE